jgi:hypothetical protein
MVRGPDSEDSQRYWNKARQQIEQVTKGIAESSVPGLAIPTLDVYFWEPSPLISAMPRDIRNLCYTESKNLVAFGHRTEVVWLTFVRYTPSRWNMQSTFRPQISHLYSSLYLKKAEIDQAVIRLPNRYRHLLDILAHEHKILDSIQQSYGDQIHIRAARDFANTYISRVMTCLQPWLYEPHQWAEAWCLDSEDLISEDKLIEICQPIKAAAALCHTNCYGPEKPPSFDEVWGAWHGHEMNRQELCRLSGQRPQVKMRPFHYWAHPGVKMKPSPECTAEYFETSDFTDADFIGTGY